jgi:hypothetical protein
MSFLVVVKYREINAKRVHRHSKSITLGALGQIFEILDSFRKSEFLMNVDCQELGPPNQTNPKKEATRGGPGIPARTKLLPRRGTGGGKPPPRLRGLRGSDRKGEKFGRSEEKREDLHADLVGRRIITYMTSRSIRREQHYAKRHSFLRAYIEDNFLRKLHSCFT